MHAHPAFMEERKPAARQRRDNAMKKERGSTSSAKLDSGAKTLFQELLVVASNELFRLFSRWLVLQHSVSGSQDT